MKPIIIVLLLSIIGFAGKAQLPEPGTYKIDNSINKFIGNWQWVSGLDTIIIKFKKVKSLFPSQYYRDELIGTHSYTRGGLTVENYLSSFDSIGPNRKGSLGLIGNYPGVADTLTGRGFLWDNAKHKNVQLTLKYVPGTPAKAIWHLEPFEGAVMAPELSGVTLPRDLILIKQ